MTLQTQTSSETDTGSENDPRSELQLVSVSSEKSDVTAEQKQYHPRSEPHRSIRTQEKNLIGYQLMNIRLSKLMIVRYNACKILLLAVLK